MYALKFLATLVLCLFVTVAVALPVRPGRLSFNTSPLLTGFRIFR